MFQFLLGTLKTEARPGILEIGRIVSIPFRYAENYIAILRSAEYSEVSIPFRYAENPLEKNIWIPRLDVSIPFRYAENQVEVAILVMDLAGFNSF